MDRLLLVAILAGLAVIYRKQRCLTQKLLNMPTKEEFDAAFAEIGDSLTNVSEDITQLTDSLAAGDLSAEQEADVFTKLRGVADTIKQIADRTKAPGEGEEISGEEA